jgi:hypothetical protein
MPGQKNGNRNEDRNKGIRDNKNSRDQIRYAVKQSSKNGKVK